jgi:hypothetical protein
MPNDPEEIILVHGTFASDKSPAGNRWWQETSYFWDWLNGRFHGRVRCAEPLQWKGRNKESDRRKAGRKLYRRLLGNERRGRAYHLIGHSHGGSVIWHALRQATRHKKTLPGLKSWTTLGTPFLRYRPQRGDLMFLVPLVTALVCAPWMVAQILLTVENRHAMWEEGAYSTLLSLALAWMVWLWVLIKSGLRIAIFARRRLFLKTNRALDQKTYDQFRERWLGLWSPRDEAIHVLRLTPKLDLRKVKDSDGRPVRIVRRWQFGLPFIASFVDLLVFEWLRRFVQGNDLAGLQLDEVRACPVSDPTRKPLAWHIHRKLIGLSSDEGSKALERFRLMLIRSSLSKRVLSLFGEDENRPSAFSSMLVHTLYLPGTAGQVSETLIAEEVARHIDRHARAGLGPETLGPPADLRGDPTFGVNPAVTGEVTATERARPDDQGEWAGSPQGAAPVAVGTAPDPRDGRTGRRRGRPVGRGGPPRKTTRLQRCYAATAVQRAWVYLLLLISGASFISAKALFDGVRMVTPEFQIDRVLQDAPEDQVGISPSDIALADDRKAVDAAQEAAAPILATWGRSLYSASIPEPTAGPTLRPWAIPLWLRKLELEETKVDDDRLDQALKRIEDPRLRADALVGIAKDFIKDARQQEEARREEPARRAKTLARRAAVRAWVAIQEIDRRSNLAERNDTLTRLVKLGLTDKTRSKGELLAAIADAKKWRENRGRLSIQLAPPTGGDSTRSPGAAPSSPTVPAQDESGAPPAGRPVVPSHVRQASQRLPVGRDPETASPGGAPSSAPTDAQPDRAIPSTAEGAPGAAPSVPKVETGPLQDWTPEIAQKIIRGEIEAIDLLGGNDPQEALAHARQLRTDLLPSGGEGDGTGSTRPGQVDLKPSASNLIHLAKLLKSLGSESTEYLMPVERLFSAEQSPLQLSESIDALISEAEAVQALELDGSLRQFAARLLKAGRGGLYSDDNGAVLAARIDQWIRVEALLLAAGRDGKTAAAIKQVGDRGEETEAEAPMSEAVIEDLRSSIARIRPTPEELQDRRWIRGGSRDAFEERLDRFPQYRVRLRIRLAHLLLRADRPDEALALLQKAWDDAKQKEDDAEAKEKGSFIGRDRQVAALAEIVAFQLNSASSKPTRSFDKDKHLQWDLDCLNRIAALRADDQDLKRRAYYKDLARKLVDSETAWRALRRSLRSLGLRKKPPITGLDDDDFWKLATKLDQASGKSRDDVRTILQGSGGMGDLPSELEKVKSRRKRSFLAARCAILWAYLGDPRHGRLACEQSLPEDRLVAHAAILEARENGLNQGRYDDYAKILDRLPPSDDGPPNTFPSVVAVLPADLPELPAGLPEPRAALDPRELVLLEPQLVNPPPTAAPTPPTADAEARPEDLQRLSTQVLDPEIKAKDDEIRLHDAKIAEMEANIRTQLDQAYELSEALERARAEADAAATHAAIADQYGRADEMARWGAKKSELDALKAKLSDGWKATIDGAGKIIDGELRETRLKLGVLRAQKEHLKDRYLIVQERERHYHAAEDRVRRRPRREDERTSQPRRNHSEPIPAGPPLGR